MHSDQNYVIYENPEDYFPYIGHTLSQGKEKMRLKERTIGDLFSKSSMQGNAHVYTGPSGLYNSVTAIFNKEHTDITADEKSVQIIIPRHKSLFDYIIHQPLHFKLINKKIMIVAGNNLFVHSFNESLRYFGGFMFLREDVVLKHKGLPNAFLNKHDYLKKVFPEYLKQQVFCEPQNRHDMLVYLEYEKDRATGKTSSGRTKSGRLRELNWSFLKVLYDLAHETGVKLYLTPVNVSFSKIPDAPYVVHPTKLEGSFKNIRYLAEQSFVFQRYSSFAKRKKRRKLDIVVNYGKPEPFSEMNLLTFRDFRKYSDGLKHRIGELDTVFPLQLICLALGDKNEMNIHELESRCKDLLVILQEKNVYTAPLCDEQGNLLPVKQIIDKSLTLLNSNPNLYIMNYDQRHIMTFKKGRLVCQDPLLKTWYANMFSHLFG